MMQTISGGFQMLMSETENPVVIGLERFIYIFSDISYIHTHRQSLALLGSRM